MSIVPAFDLSGRVALITGASSGFGAHFAQLLAAAGAAVVIGARRADRLSALQEKIRAAGGRALAVSLDVADEQSTIAAYDAAEAAFGTVDTIVANAGIADDQIALKVEMESFDRVVATNLRGPFLTVREGAKRLIAAGSVEKEHGRVVIIGSITSKKAFPGSTPYSATKAGVTQMGKLMAREWARKGINVNMIEPGYFPTEITGELMESEMGDLLLKTFIRRRWCEIPALDVPLLYLCSDLSRYVTGSVITVDDGQTL